MNKHLKPMLLRGKFMQPHLMLSYVQQANKSYFRNCKKDDS